MVQRAAETNFIYPVLFEYDENFPNPVDLFTLPIFLDDNPATRSFIVLPPAENNLMFTILLGVDENFR